MCVSNYAASKGSEENGENNRGLVKSFLLLRTVLVVPAVCNMGERVLLTVRALSKAAKTRAKRGEERAKRPLEPRTPKPKDMMREVRQEEGGAAH